MKISYVLELFTFCCLETNPIPVNSSTSPVLAVIEKFPLASVIVPLSVPTIFTDVFGTETLSLADFTVPVMVRCCAIPIIGSNITSGIKNTSDVIFLLIMFGFKFNKQFQKNLLYNIIKARYNIRLEQRMIKNR